MFLSLFVLTTSLQIISVSGQEISVVRHIDGDIFTVEGMLLLHYLLCFLLLINIVKRYF